MDTKKNSLKAEFLPKDIIEFIEQSLTSKQIETHTDLQWLINKRNWGVKGLTTSNNIKIWPRGRGAQVRGAVYGKGRPYIIISDDIDDQRKEAAAHKNRNFTVEIGRWN